MSYTDFISIMLTALGVMITLLAVFIASLALLGYRQMLKSAEQKALTVAADIIDSSLGRVDKRDSHQALIMIQAGICDGGQFGTSPYVGRGMGVL